MLSLKLQYFGHLMRRVISLEKTLMLGGIGSRRRRGQQRMRWLDGITNWCTWVWVNPGSWWWTGRPGVLWIMGSQCHTQLSNWTDWHTHILGLSWWLVRKVLYIQYVSSRKTVLSCLCTLVDSPQVNFFWVQSAVLWDLSFPRSGIKLMPHVLEAGSLNHWTAREVSQAI